MPIEHFLNHCCVHAILSLVLLDRYSISTLSALGICHIYINYFIHSSQNCEVAGADIIIPISQQGKLRHHNKPVKPENN